MCACNFVQRDESFWTARRELLKSMCCVQSNCPYVRLCVCVHFGGTSLVWKREISVFDGKILKLMAVCVCMSECVCLCVKTERWLTIPAIIDCCLVLCEWVCSLSLRQSSGCNRTAVIPKVTLLRSLPTPLC